MWMTWWLPPALKVYGQEQPVRYRSRVVKARFLEEQKVLAVWCELKSSAGQWRPAVLLLSTDIGLTSEEVIESYGLRWSMFHTEKCVGFEASMETNPADVEPMGADYASGLWLVAVAHLRTSRRVPSVL